MDERERSPGWSPERLREAAERVREAIPRADAPASEPVLEALMAALTTDAAGLRAALEAAQSEPERASQAEDAADVEAFLLDELDRVRAHAPGLAAWLEGLDEVAPLDDTYLRAAGLSRFLAEASVLPGGAPPPLPRPGIRGWRYLAPSVGVAASVLAFLAGTQVPRPVLRPLSAPSAPPRARVKRPLVAPAKSWISDTPGVETVSTETLEAVTRRAAAGDPEANRMLGLRSLQQETPDLYQAVDYLRRAAGAGDDKARMALAWVLSEGPQSVRDEEAAVHLYREVLGGQSEGATGADRGANPGDARVQAAYHLALLTYEGRGIPADAAGSLAMFRQAARRGDPRSQLVLSRLYEQGDGAAPDPSRSLDWLRRAAERWPPAQVELARRYRDGNGVDPDPAEERRWLLRAAESQEPDALFRLGEVYEAGIGLPADPGVSRRYFHQAAAAGHILAPAKLGGNPLLDEGVEPAALDVKP